MSKKDFSIDVSDALNIISKHLMLLTADDLKIDEITHLCIKDIIYQALQINNTKLIFNQSQATSVIGRVIKKERERLRYTQDQLAKLFPVAVRTIVGWENGYTSPSAAHIFVLGNLGFNLKEIFINNQLETVFLAVSSDNKTIFRFNSYESAKDFILNNSTEYSHYSIWDEIHYKDFLELQNVIKQLNDDKREEILNNLVKKDGNISSEDILKLERAIIKTY